MAASESKGCVVEQREGDSCCKSVNGDIYAIIYGCIKDAIKYESKKKMEDAFHSIPESLREKENISCHVFSNVKEFELKVESLKKEKELEHVTESKIENCDAEDLQAVYDDDGEFSSTLYPEKSELVY